MSIRKYEKFWSGGVSFNAIETFGKYVYGNTDTSRNTINVEQTNDTK